MHELQTVLFAIYCSLYLRNIRGQYEQRLDLQYYAYISKTDMLYLYFYIYVVCHNSLTV